MKNLYLIRHARAADQQEFLTDYERPLTNSGQKESRTMAARLRSAGLIPDLIISSPASRALETAHIFADICHYPIQKILLNGILYDSAESETYLNIIREITPSQGVAFIFGHNPGLTDFARFLDHSFVRELPKAGVVGLEFDGNWQEIGPGSGRAEFYDHPDRKEFIARPAPDILMSVENNIYDSLYAIFDKVNPMAVKTFEKKLRRAASKLARRFFEQAGRKSPSRLDQPE